MLSSRSTGIGCCDHVVERSSVEELHAHVDAAVGELAEVFDRDDVAVADRRRRSRLLAEPLDGLAVRHDLGTQQLDREVLLDVDVIGGVDLAHAAFAELAHQSIAPIEHLADKRRGLHVRLRSVGRRWSIHTHEVRSITRKPPPGFGPTWDGRRQRLRDRRRYRRSLCRLARPGTREDRHGRRHPVEVTPRTARKCLPHNGGPHPARRRWCRGIADPSGSRDRDRAGRRRPRPPMYRHHPSRSRNSRRVLRRSPDRPCNRSRPSHNRRSSNRWNRS